MPDGFRFNAPPVAMLDQVTPVREEENVSVTVAPLTVLKP